jgi:acetyl esterase/lipase
MPNPHHGHAGSDFRGEPRRSTIAEVQAIDRMQRTADLRLRGATSMPVRVRWPTGSREPAPMAIFLPDVGPRNGVDPADDELCTRLCAGVGAVVLCAPWASQQVDAQDSPLERAASVLEWSAHHATELGGDPNRLLLAGSGVGAAAAAVLAFRSGERGWPRIARQLLILREPASRPSEDCKVFGSAAAPATIASPGAQATPCAERLRARGIEVDEHALEDLEALWQSLRRYLSEAA